ncbi:MAG: MarR family transcriptional regulator [Polyangiales bacterium]
MSQTESPDLSKLGNTLEFMQALWALSHGLETRSKAMLADFGVTGPQRLAIRILGRFPGTSASELAELLSVHPSTVTGIVRRLEEKGLLKRKADSNDGRRSHLILTPAGKKMDQPRAGTVEAVVKKVLSRYSAAEVAKAQALLEELAKALVDAK